MPRTQGDSLFDVPTLAELRERPGVKWTRYGPDAIPMWVADMDYPVAPGITDALNNAIADGDFGYPDPAVAAEVRQQFAARMGSLHGWHVSSDDVTLVQDVIQSIQLVLHTCVPKGAGVAIQTPIYHPFLTSLISTGHRLVDNPWIPTETSWTLDIDGLRRQVENGEVAALLLCNPHNPLGRVLVESELRALADLAVEYDLMVISDEIHAEILHLGHTHTPIASLGTDIAERTVTMSSASKPYNLAALKCAQMHTESQRVRDGLAALPNHALGGLNVFGLVGTLAAWQTGANWHRDMNELTTSNRDLLARLLAARIPAMGFRVPEATYLAWLDGRRLGLDVEVSKFMLKHAGVVGNPGLDFGDNGRNHVRLNFATSPDIIEMAVDRMAAALSG
jgi:cystathionine beta-lyase